MNRRAKVLKREIESLKEYQLSKGTDIIKKHDVKIRNRIVRLSDDELHKILND